MRKLTIDFSSGKQETFEVTEVTIGSGAFLIQLADGTQRGWNMSKIARWEASPKDPT